MGLAWPDLDWDAVTKTMQGSSEGQELLPLMQAALDSAGIPVAELCAAATSTCAAGLFALRVSVVTSLLHQGRLVQEEAVSLIEPAAGAFAAAFGPALHSTMTLKEEFGEDRREPLTLPQMAMQMLGRLLYGLAGLPPPDAAPPENATGQFAFGMNWRQFVERGRITMRGVLSAVREARRAVGGAPASLHGLRVLDLGCGSGLQSLSLALLGADVDSVDAQQAALEATRRVRAAFPATTGRWSVGELSALDARGLAGRRAADVVYAWGVLHHTGDLWGALHNAQLPLADDGLLLAAIYAVEFYDEKDNLMAMKRFYRNATAWRKEQLEIAVGIHWLRPLLKAGRSPFDIVREFTEQRGMDFWTDVRDWLGGWPMEFASAAEVISFARRSGLRCIGVRRYGGNTEFQLVRPAGVARWTAGRACYGLEAFEEDADDNFRRLQQRFYHHGEDKPPRRWWRCAIPTPLRVFSDGPDEPQRDRLLMITAGGEPFGYPSAHFARPDALADPALRFHAFWEGTAFASPSLEAEAEPVQALVGLKVCLLPSAELAPEALAAIRAQVSRGLEQLIGDSPAAPVVEVPS